MASELSYGEVIKEALVQAKIDGDEHAFEQLSRLVGGPEELTKLIDSLHANLHDDEDAIEPDDDISDDDDTNDEVM